MSDEMDISGDQVVDNPKPPFEVKSFSLEASKEIPGDSKGTLGKSNSSKDWDYGAVPVSDKPSAPVHTQPFNPEEDREATRGDLARGLLWLLTFAIGGVLVFVGLGRLEGTVLTQSVFPSLIALAGTALGFYFGSQASKPPDSPRDGK